MIGIDVGGTFTDIIAVEDGEIRAYKVPTNVRDTHLSVLASADLVNVPEAPVFNHASTHGLNAILTRNLPKVGFLTTAGHRDVLDMAQSWRPNDAVTDAHWRRSFGDSTAPVVPRYLRRGASERTLADGRVYQDLDEDQARREIELLGRCGVRGIAICLINSYVNGAHEERLAELVRAVLGDIPVSVSSRVSPLAREYPRASTTVIDVTMKIVYGPYTKLLQDGLEKVGFRGQMNFADCAAQLSPVDDAMNVPSRIVFSGPAAGAVSAAYFGSLIGRSDLVCADIGGTSCDISIVRNGSPTVDTTFEIEHDLVVNTLSSQVHAIGAGGGSIVSVGPTGEIVVGPASAGADPGPACYGKGGVQPTTTDTCLLVGIIDPDRFASGFLDRDASWRAFEKLDTHSPVEQRIAHAYGIAVHNIAEGVFNQIVRAGVDPRDYDLVAYGAAGPMLLPAILELVHARSVIVPPHAGLFSALGLLSADRVFTDSRSHYTVLDESAADGIDAIYLELESALRSRLGAEADTATIVRSFDGRLLGQAWETPFIPVPDGTLGVKGIAAMVAGFHDVYAERSGARFEAIPVQGATYRVSAILPTPKVQYPVLPRREGAALVPRASTPLRFIGDEEQLADVYERTDLRAGDAFRGPAIVRERLGTVHVHQGQLATVGRYGEIVITSDTNSER
ncbi:MULTISPECIES: hydantoinase/oxoprolinase family protein [unclassified Pseudofrankia]|uniref:hydantoinase/oxoprolinase family protein n=1 Tax=unclassified Pseudofrankia TaxID=2994372 RepID=UPI0008D91AD0|nr:MULTISPECIES: hydantoinase/oxoprolinase family protein [unclassified Pseudofrankia]MDT3444684.1 hydantoinase/oxoprolinase family protein [Pseudofrankia sp. BMG5.37]OHV66577.1 5-oxoprolinase [Pseudofrankia sp. BMG5.36]